VPDNFATKASMFSEQSISGGAPDEDHLRTAPANCGCLGEEKYRDDPIVRARQDAARPIMAKKGQTPKKPSPRPETWRCDLFDLCSARRLVVYPAGGVSVPRTITTNGGGKMGGPKCSSIKKILIIKPLSSKKKTDREDGFLCRPWGDPRTKGAPCR